MDLKNKNILVTGASGAIGTAVSDHLAELGANLALHYFQGQESAEALASNHNGKGRKTVAIKADLREREEADLLLASVNDHFGPIDVVVSLSGSTVGAGSIGTASEENWKDALDSNLMSVVNTVHSAVPFLSKGGSRIVLTSSVRGMASTGREAIVAYSAAKAALINLTSTLAKDLGPETLVNCVSPGFVWTKNYEKMPSELCEEFISDTVLKRFIDPKEIAPLYAFLCQTDIITGQNIVADAGFTLKFS